MDSAGVFLQKKFGVKSLFGSLPLGIENTDTFINSVCELGDLEIPESIKKRSW